MILDIQTRMINDKPVLYKFAPKHILDNGLSMIDGFIQFDLKRFEWQPVEVLGEIKSLPLQEKKSSGVTFKVAANSVHFDGF